MIEEHLIQNNDLNLLLDVLPPHLKMILETHELTSLIEVVLDLGRKPEARFPERFIYLSEEHVTRQDIDHVIDRVGNFGGDNRAGIERTLHRISAIRNRKGDVIGLTLRVGRAVYGTIEIIRDVIEAGQSVLLLGKPGVGKTTMLREVARVLADEFMKRVVIVDTSNEIAGDGDIPHPGIGHARRMQVHSVECQHNVMIEAVENHMPEVVVIDEIGTEAEAMAARTIAERGVQLIGTAHGMTLQNLIQNPTLSDLIGGIQSVTLSDEEARRRGTQKTVLERKAPPTFGILIEIQDKNTFAIHADVASTVDLILRGNEPRPEIRIRRPDGEVEIVQRSNTETLAEDQEVFDHGDQIEKVARFVDVVKVYPYAVNRNLIERAVRHARLPVHVAKFLSDAHVVLTLKAQLRKLPPKLVEARERGVPVYAVRSNTSAQVEAALKSLLRARPQADGSDDDELTGPLDEAQAAIEEVMLSQEPVELTPQDSHIRRLQHQLAERYNLRSKSVGEEPSRRVVIFA
ncbi:MAG: R3H domain-containing nucleic acid-binding protein [Bacillota bacterium]